MKIGLVGEAPNDTQSVQNLLEKRYFSPNYEYCFLLDRFNGSQLDSQKTKRFLRIEYESKSPDIVIFIRDLDSVLPDKRQLDLRKKYFTSSNKIVDNKGLYLLNIYEIEALILADIETFNMIYNCQIPEEKNPMGIKEPKELLRSISKDYNESENPYIFSKLNFENASNCKYFKVFINRLEKNLKKK